MKKLLVLTLVSFVVGCSSVAPKPNVAQEKTLDLGAKTITLGGEYWLNKNKLTIMVDQEPLLKGSFPPYTPTLKLNGNYDGVAVSAYCYFGSVLASKGRLVGAISGAIQGAKGKSADTCEVTADNQGPVTLYF